MKRRAKWKIITSTLITIFICISTIFYCNYLSTFGYSFSIDKAVQKGLNNSLGVHNAKIEISYKIDKNNIILLVATDDSIGIVNVKENLKGLFFKYIGGAFYSKSIIDKNGEEMLMSSYEQGAKQTGFSAVSFKSNKIPIHYETYKPDLYLLKFPYTLMIWYNGNHAPLSIFDKDFIFHK